MSICPFRIPDYFSFNRRYAITLMRNLALPRFSRRDER